MPPETSDRQARHIERWKERMRAAGGEHIRDCIFRHGGRTFDLNTANPDAAVDIIRYGFFVVDDEETPDGD